MLTADLTDLAYDVFGGYVPAMPPQNCPPGASPSCQDGEFPGVGVVQRGGLASVGYNNIAAFASINGIENYTTSTLQKLLIIWDSLGNLYYENPQGTLNVLAQNGSAGLIMNAASAFGRKYMAFGNNVGGVDFPRQFDGTNYDRVSQCGPGAPPTVVDYTFTVPITSLTETDGTGIGIVEVLPISSTVADVVVSSNLPTDLHGNILAQPGDIVKLSGTTIGGYNANFTILSILGPGGFQISTPNLGTATGGTVNFSMISITFSAQPFSFNPANVTISGATVAGYNIEWMVRQRQGAGTVTGFYLYSATGVFGLGAATGASFTITGNITMGLHQCTVVFITRQGYITRPAPPFSWTAAGNLKANVTNIPTGPANVVSRLLLFTAKIDAPATTGPFFSSPNGTIAVGGVTTAMLIGDNVTTSAVIDFSDTDLIAGFNAEYLFNLVELGSCYGVASYSYRTCWIGEAVFLNGLNNLEFNGGWNIGSGTDLPLGWDVVPGGADSGGNRLAGGGVWHDAFRFNVGGSTHGISQSTVNFSGVNQIQVNTSYSIRFRARTNQVGGTSFLTFTLTSASVGFTTSFTRQITSNNYGLYSIAFPNVTPASLGSDTQLQITAAGGGGFTIDLDSLEPFPTNAPINQSVCRMSYAFNPESFDSTTGQVQVTPGDGWQMTAQFTIRDSFYIGKTHYLAYTTDDGQNEPSSWTVTEVSKTIGVSSPNAVDTTEEWAAFSDRTGAYVCWGSDPAKITPEIQFDASKTGKICWNSINWNAENTIWTRIDRINKKILFGVPLGAAIAPSNIFMLDFQFCANAQDMADSPWGGVAYSSFTGKMLYHGRGRRWMPWTIAASSMCFAERADGTVQPFFGNASQNALIYQQKDASIQSSDNNAAINFSYQLSFMPDSQTAQQLPQIGLHRLLLGYLAWRAIGSGFLNISVTSPARTKALRVYQMSLMPPQDGTRPIDMSGERFSVTFGVNAAGSWGQIEKLVLSVKKHPSIVVRGTNS